MVTAQEFAHDIERRLARVEFSLDRALAVLEPYPVPPGPEYEEGVVADEAVPPKVLTIGHALKQECVALRSELAENRDGGLQIGEKLLINGDQIALLGEAQELRAFGNGQVGPPSLRNEKRPGACLSSRPLTPMQ